MSTSQGCSGDMAVVESFKDALLSRVGKDRYQMWFAHGVDIELASPSAGQSESTSTEAIEAVTFADDRDVILLRVRGQFALDRLRKHFLREIRGAAMQASGSSMDVQLCLDEPPAAQVELPLEVADSVEPAGGENASQSAQSPDLSTMRRPRRSKPRSLARLMADGEVTGASRPGKKQQAQQQAAAVKQLELPRLEPAEAQAAGESQLTVAARKGQLMAADRFVVGSCNQLAYTAMEMVCQNPRAASPLFLCGPTGIGKTHLMTAIAERFRREHRMRRVMHLSAEQFTNDFINSVGGSGIAAFRRRYREVDALLIDDVQFLGAKKATLREMLYTVETLALANRPLVFSGSQSPTEIEGLSHELAGRMAAGLVCSVQPLDAATREVIFRRWIDERCPLGISEELVEQVVPMLAGDGRVISGVVNTINTLQRMNGRAPTMDEVRQFAGQLLRAAKPLATMSVIERAVCNAFDLPKDTLRSRSQSRAVTEPRMLAMYLSRQLTSSAYSEIARHFGGKSHSTAISAENNVKSWLEQGKAIGRGHRAMSAKEALDRVETLLRSG